MMSEDKKTTDFGFEEVPLAEKAKRVGAVFSSVASRYDVMNDILSFGLHRGWKRWAMLLLRLRPGMQVLDVAGGSGDLTQLAAKRVGDTGSVVLTDINPDMLAVGRKRLLDAGFANIPCILANAEQLPFQDNTFDRVMIGFGLRNVTDKPAALRSMLRVLKPGGLLVILEFSKPIVPGLQTVYDAYSFHLLPKIGHLVANDEDSYRYLAESIRQHPDQATLKALCEAAGFVQCDYHNLSGGIVAIHRGVKP
ncbi:MAG: bifunctional demethylmenaquinone methyltransferase/2-methoxy-6-polyprenyl-1,4-benzoquinol methylase [Gammaproteobacteria bacterium RIFCSPHIGHO2_12_FULL_45_9]|nr:MAG: bifunctional demethylmenaquinone methyltransferase/2-methoxy-6-polyprenyl-1,4-benzoquinol methylase [Gammaproteobacteria bacterium RIFCSPHIGHO2_12_FULL_45_9]